MKKAISLLFALIMVLSLAGCSNTVAYTNLELTMQVPPDMKDVAQDESIQEYGFTFAIENEQIFICGLRQELVSIQNGLNMTTQDYAAQIVQNYGLTGRATVGDRASKDYVYLRFSIPLENGVNEYLCGVYKTDKAFWLLQMNGKTENFDEAKWYEYLDSVTFNG